MSSPIQNVILLGASGIPGPTILAELLSSPLNITVVSRTDSQATFPAGVAVVKSDYTFPSLVAAFADQDAVISLLGKHGFSAQKTVIDAAIAAGVKRFVPSEIGVDTSDPRIVAQVPFVAGKCEVVAYLRGKQDSISWTVLITGIFFDWALWQGWFGVDLEGRKVKLWDGGEARFATTEIDVVGRALAAILSRGEACERAKNAYVRIAGHVTTQKEILAAVEKVTGEKFRVYAELDAAAYGEKVRGEIAEGNWEHGLDLLKVVTFGKKEELGVFPECWNEYLGLPQLDMEQTVSEVVTGVRKFWAPTSWLTN